jgi:hypothetical protein
MTALRQLSSRPELLRDQDSGSVLDPSSQSLVGISGPLGRERCVYAIPMGPVDIVTPLLVHDTDGAYLADAQGNLIGMPRVTVHRMLSARWTEDTRRLAG